MSYTGTNSTFPLTCRLTADYIIRSITPLETTATEIRLCGWTGYTEGCREFLYLLQSALQSLKVLACSNIVEYSQQEGFYRVPLPAARQAPNLEDQ